MFNIGPGELIVILIVALVLLGPDKLPEMARTVGKGMRELRRATEDLKDQVENEMFDLDLNKPRSPILRPPPGPRVAQAPPPVSPVQAALPPAEAAVAAAPVAPAPPAQPEVSQASEIKPPEAKS